MLRSSIRGQTCSRMVLEMPERVDAEVERGVDGRAKLLCQRQLAQAGCCGESTLHDFGQEDRK